MDCVASLAMTAERFSTLAWIGTRRRSSKLRAETRTTFLHHFCWRDIYHSHRAPVYQHFWCGPRKWHDRLRVTRMPRRL